MVLMVVLLTWLIAPAQAPDPLALTREAAVQALARAPELREQRPGEPFEITQMAPVPGYEDRAWYVEVQWAAGVTLRTGIALITRPEIKKRERVPVSPSSPWNVAEFTPDKTWASLEEDLQQAQVDANEAAAVADLRALVLAQMAFASAGAGGFAPAIACLFSPVTCAPAIAHREPLLSDAALRRAERNGYRFTLHAGPAAPGPAGDSRAAATYAYTAVPLVPGSTGRRAFCTDSTGGICARADGQAPVVAGGLCAQPCVPLR